MERKQPSRSGSLLEGFEVVDCGGCPAFPPAPTAAPVRGSTVDRLEDILSEAIGESLQSVKSRAEPLVEQRLSVCPEANILAHAPEDLDLYREIFNCTDSAMDNTGDVQQHQHQPESCRLVGGSKFYEVMEAGGGEEGMASPDTPTEKQDYMKPIDSDDEVSDVDQECTIFNGVSYLGLATIAAPKHEPEIQRIMGTLSSQRESETGIAVSISIPVCSQGLVVLYDATTNSVMARYAVKRISFYARGAVGSAVAACFAFTWSHGETKESAVYQCHVFRCHIAEAVQQVSSCFAKAFERVPRSMASSLMGELSQPASMSCSMQEHPAALPAPPMQLMHVLECTLDIKEADAKGALSHVPKERLGFKVRGGIDKQVDVTVQQVSSHAHDQATYTGGLIIERCFGVLLAPGRSVKHSDMRLLEMVSGELNNVGCSVCARWNAGESALAAFNAASGDGAPAYMSIGLDLVIRGMCDPLRLVIETPVKIYPPTERFWYYSKRPLVQQFYINLKEINSNGQLSYEVASVETSGELDRSRLNLPLSLSSLLPLAAATAPASPAQVEDSDGDEPLLSGTGEVSKDCCEGVLENWAQVLRSWTDTRPRALPQLVRGGVPEALRGEVWQRLTGADQYQHLMDTYRVLISKDCPFDSVIQRDIARTFPAHDYFREAGGLGQDSLQRVARAYAVYDEEVGYCQGHSFLAATLLLHMPEEQTFCVLVRLMYGYGLRELYKDGFEALYLRLHQLERLMEEQLPELRQHFQAMGVEPHMFASQWFLTLFTARFPLPLVFHIVDVFLLQGTETLFQIALALLTRWRRELMQLDFEGILKFFRVTLPKKYRGEEESRQLVKLACSIKVKRLHKYQLEFESLTQEARDKEKVTAELERLREVNTQLQQEREALEQRLGQAHAATAAALAEVARHTLVTDDYRGICARSERTIFRLQEIISDCPTCRDKLIPPNHKSGAGETDEENREKEGDSEPDTAETQLQRRVRELELQLAQVKLAHVEAECRNQELSHQLHATITEYQTALNQKLSLPPWLARTLGSIKEAAASTRPTFQTYLGNNADVEGDVQLRRQDSSPGSLAAPASPRPARANSVELRRKRHSLADTQRASRRSRDLASLVSDLPPSTTG